MFFFFSSRRRHTRCSRDWSSDVCSSDLGHYQANCKSLLRQRINPPTVPISQDRSEERRVGKGVDLGGRRIIKKKKKKKIKTSANYISNASRDSAHTNNAKSS